MTSYEAEAMSMRELKDYLGWKDDVTMDDLTAAVMALCTRVQILEYDLRQVRQQTPKLPVNAVKTTPEEDDESARSAERMNQVEQLPD